MTKKVSVYVIIPGAYERFNFLIPENMSIEASKRLVCRLITKSGFILCDTDNMKLLHTSSGMVLPNELTLAQTGVTDGSELLMVGEDNGRY